MQLNQFNIKKIKGLTVLFMALGLLVGCHDDKTQQSAKQVVAVNVFHVNPLTYQLKVTLPARVTPYEVAEIRPQVGGIIQKREFVESSMVEQGQSLYQIDPAIYQAQYDSAEATLNNATLNFNRYQALLKNKAVSKQDYDSAYATMKEALASFNVAKTNLDYTKVTAPISGYIGKSNVTVGALVANGQSTELAVIQKLDPVYVDMTQSASQFLSFQSQKNKLFKPVDKVNLYLPDGSIYPYQGDVIFSDRSVNETTGTITIRAEFKNPEEHILPNMFVKPELIIGEIENAILVPQSAVTLNADLTYSAVVVVPDAKKTGDATQRYHLEQRNNVQVYEGLKGYWIITDGLKADELVVTRGLISLQGKNLNDPKVQENLDIVINEQKTLTQQEADKL